MAVKLALANRFEDSRQWPSTVRSLMHLHHTLPNICRNASLTRGTGPARRKSGCSLYCWCGERDRADRDATVVLPSRVDHLKEKIAKVKEQMQTLGEIDEQMKASVDGQISLTDPDARSMATSGRGTGVVGYNVQTAVDAKHHMIVAHEVTNVGHDRDQLANMAHLAKQATGERKLIALADRGYYEGHEILKCEQPVSPRSCPRR